MNKITINNKFISSLIIPLIIFFLIPGPFIPDLILSISALSFLFIILKNNNFEYFKNKFFITFLIFYIYCVALSLFSEEMISVKSSLTFIRFGLFACFIIFLINTNKEKIFLYLYVTFIIIFSILIIDGFYQYFSGKNLIGYKLYKNIRVSSFFGEELILGSYVSRFFPLFFALFIVKKKTYSYEKYFIAIIFVCLDILIYISGERTAFFFLNLSTITIILLIKKFQLFRLITFLIGLMIIFIISINNSVVTKRMFSEINEHVIKAEETKRKIFTPIHDSHIRTAFNIFLDRPLTGYGPKMFRVMCKKEEFQVGIKPCSTHPHNFYVQLLSETGVIGFSFLLVSFLYIISCLIRQLKSVIFFEKKRPFSDYQVCLLSALLITVWPFSPNGNFFNNWLATVYTIPLGFYLHSIYMTKAKGDKN